MNRIADFIQRQLQKINSEHSVKVYANEQSAIERVRAAITRHNELVNKMSGFEGIDVDSNDAKILMPDALRRKPLSYTATATKNHFMCDGEFAGQTKLELEITI